MSALPTIDALDALQERIDSIKSRSDSRADAVNAGHPKEPQLPDRSLAVPHGGTRS